MSNLLTKLETATRNYLKTNKSLTDVAIDQLIAQRSRQSLTFWQSLRADTGVERGIRTLLQINSWKQQDKKDGPLLQQTILHYLQNNMGSSKFLRVNLDDVLALDLGLDIKEIEGAYRASIPIQYETIPEQYYFWIEDRYIKPTLDRLLQPRELDAAAVVQSQRFNA